MKLRLDGKRCAAYAAEAVVCVLMRAPATKAELVRHTGWSSVTVSRALHCLQYTGRWSLVDYCASDRTWRLREPYGGQWKGVTLGGLVDAGVMSEHLAHAVACQVTGSVCVKDSP